MKKQKLIDIILKHSNSYNEVNVEKVFSSILSDTYMSGYITGLREANKIAKETSKKQSKEVKK